MKFPSLIEFIKYYNMFLVGGPLVLAFSIGAWYAFIRSLLKKEPAEKRKGMLVMAVLSLILGSVHFLGAYGSLFKALRWRRVTPARIESLRIEQMSRPSSSRHKVLVFSDSALIQQGFSALSSAKKSPFYRSWEHGYRIQLRFFGEQEYSSFYLSAYQIGFDSRGEKRHAWAVIPHIGKTHSGDIQHGGEYVSPEFHQWIQAHIVSLFEREGMYEIVETEAPTASQTDEDVLPLREIWRRTRSLLPIFFALLGLSILFPGSIHAIWRISSQTTVPSPFSAWSLLERLSPYGRAAGIGALAGMGGAVMTLPDWHRFPLFQGGAGAVIGLLTFHVIRRFDDQKDMQDLDTQEKIVLLKAAGIGVVAGILFLHDAPYGWEADLFYRVLIELPLGIFGVLMLWQCLRFGASLSSGVSVLVYKILYPLWVTLRYHTLLCQHCWQYSFPRKSRYESGKRYCEHCSHEIAEATSPGKVIFIFGILLDKPQEDRTFIISNPDVEARDIAFDVAEVYIDTQTCNVVLLERFITYVMNFPPKNGLQSIRIFYRGDLQQLGQNLYHALRNNFQHISSMHE